MDERIVIRPMREEDLREVMAIEMDSFCDPWSSFAYTCELRNNPKCAYYVALERGYVVGYAGFWWGRFGAKLLKIAVEETRRGSGIARSLLEEVERAARDQGQEVLQLEVAALNGRARGFYEKNGFELAGRIAGYYERTGEDALIYVLNLEN